MTRLHHWVGRCATTTPGKAPIAVPARDSGWTTQGPSTGSVDGMNTLHSRIMIGALLLSPVLLTASELARLTVDNAYVENDANPVADTASHLQAVADRLGLWHAAGLLEVAFAATWCIALLAAALVIARSRPVLAAATGLAGLLSTLGVAMHTAFYYVPLAGLAQEPDQALAAKAGAIGADDPLLGVALALFLLGTLAAILAMGLGLWRAGVLPWWGGLGVVAWLGSVVAGSELPAAALVNLVLLLPFAVVAARLRKPGETVPQAEFAVA